MSHGFGSVDTMVSVRKTPWHRLGTVVPDYVGVGEALRLGGLDFSVEGSPVTFGVPGGSGSMPEFKVLWREHPDSSVSEPLPLGVVGQNYSVVQPADMAELAEAVLAESLEPLRVETCGTLKESRVGWVQVVMPEAITIADDPHVGYLLIANSWDGSTALRIVAGQTRVVCANTLAAAKRRAKTSFSIRHTVNALTRVADARSALQMAAAANAEFQREVEGLLLQPFSDAQFGRLVEAVFPITDEMLAAENQAGVTRANNLRDELHAIWRAPNGPVANIKNTAYGAVMAVSDYELWGSTRKSQAEFQALSVLNAAQPRTDFAREIVAGMVG